MAEDHESRLSRWSRLKRRQTASAAASTDSPRRGGAMPVASDRPEEGAENSQDLAARSADQHPADLPSADLPPADLPPADLPPADLPSVESLTGESDFTAFLADGVPEELKRAALRKLWLSHPAFAIIDGLDDYDEDFRIVDKMLATADELRKVGKDMEGAGEKAETAEPGEGEDEDEAGDEETAAAEGDDEAPGAAPEPGRPEKEQE